MHKVIINGIDLSEEFIISESQYPVYSKVNIYKTVPERSSHFYKITDESKPVTLVFNKKEQCMDSIELQHYMESFVANKLKTKEPTWIEVDGRYMFAILDAISDSDMYQGKVIATFMNLPGKWYGAEKISTTSIINNGVDETRQMIMAVTPSALLIRIKNSLGDKLELKPFNTTSTITIDFYNKTLRQDGRHVPISLDSRFFNFGVGTTSLIVEGATIESKFREVLAI